MKQSEIEGRLQRLESQTTKLDSAENVLLVAFMVALFFGGLAFTWNFIQEEQLGTSKMDIEELYNLPSIPEGYSEECFETKTIEEYNLFTKDGSLIKNLNMGLEDADCRYDSITEKQL